MELELFATKKITVQVVISEEELLDIMKRKMFNKNDIAVVRRKLVEGDYLATFVPTFYDGNEGTIFIDIDGYNFKLEAQEDVR